MSLYAKLRERAAAGDPVGVGVIGAGKFGAMYIAQAVVGRLIPAERSRAEGCQPLGLAHGCTVRRAIPAGGLVRWSDVEIDAGATGVVVRREMERTFGRELPYLVTQGHPGRS